MLHAFRSAILRPMRCSSGPCWYSVKSMSVSDRSLRATSARKAAELGEVGIGSPSASQGWPARRASSAPSAGRPRQASTTPASTADRASSPKRAERGLWARVIPPPSRMASNPSTPSAPFPESSTPTVCRPRSAAIDLKSESIGCCGRGAPGSTGRSLRRPCSTRRLPVELM